MARLTKDGNNPRGQKAEIVSKAPSSIIVIPASELVQVIAKVVLHFLCAQFSVLNIVLMNDICLSGP